MRRCSVLLAMLVVAATYGVGAQGRATSDVPLETLLLRLGTYVDAFETRVAAVVSEEHYWQQMDAASRNVPAERRVLKSDVLMASAGEAGWVAFRDVFEVDGATVRDRDDRLAQLFIHPLPDSREQVARIAEASSRFNIGWVNRTINIPTMALGFARSGEHHRSEFRRGGLVRIEDVETREIRFQERTLPRMIHTPDAAPANGRFWIEPDSGRVVRTELKVATGPTTAIITVDYANQADLNLWLPVRMEERYSAFRRPTITGSATYEKFRRFDVAVGTVIK